MTSNRRNQYKLTAFCVVYGTQQPITKGKCKPMNNKSMREIMAGPACEQFIQNLVADPSTAGAKRMLKGAKSGNFKLTKRQRKQARTDIRLIAKMKAQGTTVGEQAVNAVWCSHSLVQRFISKHGGMAA